MTKTIRAALWIPLALGTACSKPAPPPPPPQPQPVVVQPAPAPLPQYITIRDRIEFETNKAILLPQSFPVLDDVVDQLKRNPQITLVEIGGHTDSVGNKEDNLRLSQERCEAVRVYLVSRGIELARLRAVGHGDQVPVATNDNEEGRFKNRRVEFRIVNQAAGH
jgi:OmpA-OmpF porin, OOP family